MLFKPCHDRTSLFEWTGFSLLVVCSNWEICLICYFITNCNHMWSTTIPLQIRSDAKVNITIIVKTPVLVQHTASPFVWRTSFQGHVRGEFLWCVCVHKLTLVSWYKVIIGWECAGDKAVELLTDLFHSLADFLIFFWEYLTHWRNPEISGREKSTVVNASEKLQE